MRTLFTFPSTPSCEEGNPARSREVQAINRFHVEALAHLLGRLAAAEEAGAALLDSAMIVYGSGIADGQTHAHDDLPVLLAGSGGGLLRPGRHVRHPLGTPMNDLFLALFELLGVRVDAFGDGRAPLEGL